MKKYYILLILVIIPMFTYGASTLDTQGTFYKPGDKPSNDQNANVGPTVDVNDANDFNLKNKELTDKVKNENLKDNFVYNNPNKDESLNSVLEKCGNEPSKCDFAELLLVVNELLEWAMMGLASTATIMFIYAGFLYMSAQGDPNQIKKAHGIFKVVLIGFVIILLSYLLVQQFLKYFIDPNSSTIYKLLNKN